MLIEKKNNSIVVLVITYCCNPFHPWNLLLHQSVQAQLPVQQLRSWQKLGTKAATYSSYRLSFKIARTQKEKNKGLERITCMSLKAESMLFFSLGGNICMRCKDKLCSL